MSKVKSNDIVKPAKSTKPRSKLQQVQAQANWAVYFKLQPFNYHYTDKINLSDNTQYLIAVYNYTTDRLKEAIAEDAKHTKNCIVALAAREKMQKEFRENEKREAREDPLPF
tara:strand:- start:319 stop:654 length:336 start_codon:yes stop_codon:yes gene_type:complete